MAFPSLKGGPGDDRRTVKRTIIKQRKNKKMKQDYFRQALALLVVLPLLSFTSAGDFSRAAGRIAADFAAAGLSAVMQKYGAAVPEDAILKEGLDVLEKCSQQYIDLKKFSMDVEYAVFYNSENFDAPNDRKTGFILRDKNNFYQEEMGNIKLFNKDHELIINQRAEFMTVRNRADQEIAPAAFEADSLVKFITKAEKVEGGFRYYLQEGALEKFEIIVDSEGYMETWRTWYRDPMDFGEGEVKVITQMRYLNFTKKPKTDAGAFSVEKFISITKTGEVVAKEKYKDFYVLNQLVR
jgi:hypothetical protein